MDPVYAEIKLNGLRCGAQCDQGDPRNAAEPYLWVTFFKVDGETIIIDKASLYLKGKATVVPMPGNHGDLHTHGMKAGDNAAIPSNLGALSAVVMPIKPELPIPNAEQPGVFGCIAVAFEQDSQSDYDTAYAHEAFNGKLTELLNNFIPTLGGSHTTVTDQDINHFKKELKCTVSSALHGRAGVGDIFRDYDDLIGSAVFHFSQEELSDKGRIPFSVQMENETKTEVWQLTGEANVIIVKAFLDGVGRRPTEQEMGAWNSDLVSSQVAPEAAYSRVFETLVSSLASVEGEKEREDMVTRSYREIFGRGPWDAEMASWSDSILQNPISFNALANAHIDWLVSPAGEDEIGRVVDRTFDAVLERPPRPIEREYWIGRVRGKRLGFQQITNLL